MGQSAVLQLVSAFSQNQADPQTPAYFYRDAVSDLARDPWLTNFTIVPASTGTSQYVIPDAAIKIIAVFYDDRMLDRVDLDTLNAVSKNWRDDVGQPVAWTTLTEDVKTIRLYPQPDAASKAFTFTFGSPMGTDYPPYAVVLCHTEVRQTTPDWMDFPLAWTVAAREFTYESNHKDLQFATIAQSMADLLFGLYA